jgi:short-subunit dehydrogenase
MPAPGPGFRLLGRSDLCHAGLLFQPESPMSEAPAAATGPRRRALVTGASSGIGHAFAERLARDGYDLVVVARSREPLEALAGEVAERHAVEVEVLVADLTDPGDLGRVEARLGQAPGFDLLVNNAGVGTVGAFADRDLDGEETQIRLNVLALVRLTHAALATMLPHRHGAIVNVSSMAALAPYPFTATYAATKAFVNSFTEALHEELRDTGVRVQALCPGFTRTRFQERAGVEPSTIPRLAWMEPEAVVEASLAGLERGNLICIPGAGYRVLAGLSGAVPRGVVRRMAGLAQGRRYRE